MKQFLQKIFNFLKNPNLVFLCANWFITLAGIAGSLTFVFVEYTGVFSYIVYAISAISLAYSVYTAILFAPTLKERFTAQLKKKRLVKTFIENYSFRTLILSTVSLVINLAFVAFNIVFAVLNRSVWYAASAVYYVLLSVLKGWVFSIDSKAKKDNNDSDKYYIAQLKNYRNCGIALFILELGITAIVTLTVLQEKPMNYSEIIAIALAAYTFYKIAFAIKNVVGARKHKNPQIQTFRNIGLAEAAISLVSLQMALVATFSETGTDMTVLNALTGFTACALTIAMGIFMIINGTKLIKQRNSNIES